MATGWSTVGIPASERVDAWDDLISAHMGPMSAVHDGEGSFRAAARITTVGPATLLELTGCAHRSTVVATSAVGCRDDKVYVVAQLLGRGVARSREADAQLKPGLLGLVATGWPESVELPEDFHQLVLAVPAELLRPRLARRAEAGAVVEAVGTAGLVMHQLHYLASRGHELDSAGAAMATRQVLDLVALTFGGVGAVGRRQHVLQAALDEAERRLGEPDLSVDAVAAHVNVSVRHLQQLLAEEGTTFTRWVREQRVARCQQEFDCDLARRRSTAEISAQWGFVDHSHFSRVFTAAVGMPPREYRKRQIGRRADAAGVISRS
jgi:AraC-like DNA-binding protein